MTDDAIIQDSTPLKTHYLPSEFTARKTEEQKLESNLRETSNTGSRNLHIHGSKGTGKTHLTLSTVQQLPDRVNTVYIPGRKCRTQYKTLREIYQSITDESIKNGHHTAEFKRRIKEKTQSIPAVIILDDIEFLLQNDGNDLLYFLSRTPGITTVLISTDKVREKIEERTLSSLQPRQVPFKPLSSDDHFRMLHQRARDSLRPQSLHKDALTQITANTSNIKYSLHWLRTAAEQSDTVITETAVQNCREEAYQAYVQEMLEDFTPHHRILYNAIKQLSHQQSIQTGEVNQQYQKLCQNRSLETLSNRRISTYLKHLEQLDLIKAEYHYGGKKGKTREITLNAEISS